MLHHINSECITCGACLKECPVGAIEPGSRCYTIQDSVCLDCSACVPVCPVEAIVPAASPEEVAAQWARALKELENAGEGNRPSA